MSQGAEWLNSRADFAPRSAFDGGRAWPRRRPTQRTVTGVHAAPRRSAASRFDAEAAVRSIMARVQAEAEDLSRLALHESAHTVTMWRVGIPLAGTVVDLERRAGASRFTLDDSVLFGGEEVLAVVLAGAQGERLGGYAPVGGVSDREVAAELTRAVGLEVRQRAERLAERVVDEEQRAVRTLADTLMRQRQLSADEVSTILTDLSVPRPDLNEEYRSLVEHHQVYEFDHGVSQDEMLNRACARYGLTRDEAQQQFNRYCRRLHGLDEGRTQIRTFDWLSASEARTQQAQALRLHASQAANDGDWDAYNELWRASGAMLRSPDYRGPA